MSKTTPPVEGAEGAEVKKKKPIILFVIIGVALLGIIGTFMVTKKAGAHGHKAAVKKPVEHGPILPLDEFLVNLADPGGDHFLKIAVSLELSKEKGKTPETLKEQVPAIRDAVLTALNSKRRDEMNDNGGRARLKDEIRKRVNTALGEDDVMDVYYTNFVTQ